MITAPTKCPSCSSALTWLKDTLYCKNSLCEAQSFKRVEHFAKTMKIKGLGPSSIEKLDINAIEEIYILDVEYMAVALSSAKLSVNLFAEIKQSENQPFNLVLPAFGISLVGKTAADKLSKVCDTVFDIDTESCKKAGLGAKVTANLLEWLDNEFSKYSDLPVRWDFEQVTSTGNKGIVCISGKLNSFKTKAEATAVLTEMGYIVKDSLTKDVTILVSEEGKETAKTLKARESGITIVNNLLQFIGE
jgi:DNA ligase (NAD+)